MSHLPPRPDYDYPPPAPRGYEPRHSRGRPAPMADSYAYPPREREPYPLRSPPRSTRPPSDRLGDSYTAQPDPYMPRGYPPRHDRREGHRDWDRDWETGQPWERRDRDIERARRGPPPGPPPPSHAHELRANYRDESKAWTRREEDIRPSRRIDSDERAWTRREDGDGRRQARRGPYQGDRNYQPRRSASPPPAPRSYGSHSRRPEPPSLRRTSPPGRRSPSPRRRTPSPRRRSPSPRRRTPLPRRRTPSPGEYVSPRSPRRSSPRQPSPHKIRLGSHSIITSPRSKAWDFDERYDSREQRSRLPARSRSRSRPLRAISPSRSAKSPKRRPISRSRSRSPRSRRDSSDSSYRRRKHSRERTSTPPRHLHTIPVKEPEKSLKATEKEPELHTEQSEARDPVPKPALVPTSTSRPDQEASKPNEDPQLSEKAAPKKPLPSGLPSICYPPGQAPPVGPLDILVNVEPRPKYHLVDPLLRPRPKLQLGPSREYLARIPNFSKVDEQKMAYFEIPTYKSWYTPTFDLWEPPSKIKALSERRAHLESERPQLALETQAALFELDAALLEVRSVEKRRRLYDAQLELAKEGLLGVDFDHSKAPTLRILGGDDGKTASSSR